MIELIEPSDQLFELVSTPFRLLMALLCGVPTGGHHCAHPNPA
jgi:hypothetical protein